MGTLNTDGGVGFNWENPTDSRTLVVGMTAFPGYLISSRGGDEMLFCFSFSSSSSCSLRLSPSVSFLDAEWGRKRA